MGLELKGASGRREQESTGALGRKSTDYQNTVESVRKKWGFQCSDVAEKRMSLRVRSGLSRTL